MDYNYSDIKVVINTRDSIYSQRGISLAKRLDFGVIVVDDINSVPYGYIIWDYLDDDISNDTLRLKLKKDNICINSSLDTNYQSKLDRIVNLKCNSIIPTRWYNVDKYVSPIDPVYYRKVNKYIDLTIRDECTGFFDTKNMEITPLSLKLSDNLLLGETPSNNKILMIYNLGHLSANHFRIAKVDIAFEEILSISYLKRNKIKIGENKDYISFANENKFLFNKEEGWIWSEKPPTAGPLWNMSSRELLRIISTFVKGEVNYIINSIDIMVSSIYIAVFSNNSESCIGYISDYTFKACILDYDWRPDIKDSDCNKLKESIENLI